VSQCHLKDTATLQTLEGWRNQFSSEFINSNNETIKDSIDWLKSLLATKDEMAFLICDLYGKNYGLISLALKRGALSLLNIYSCIYDSNAHLLSFLEKAIVSLTDYLRKTINIDGFYIEDSIKSNEISDVFYKLKFDTNIEIERVNFSDTSKIGARKFKLAYKEASSVGQSMILTAGPSISAKEGVYAYDAALNGWNNQWSKYLTTFEKKFAEYVGVKYALATSSCTGALQIALTALDIGPGDEVIVPDQTWVATANAVRYVGATPIFADIELDTWNLDVNSVAKLVTNKTKAIIPVHMYGHPARMTKLLEFAAKYQLKIVEDAAPAIGAEWEGRRCGSFGSFAAFSFQGAKLMVTGEGGMLVTNDDALYQKALKIWDQGRNPSRAFWIDEHGVKFKMSNVQAAIGLGQLERVEELIDMKRRLFSWYKKGLEGVPYIHLNQEVPGARSIYWMISIRLDETAPISRDDLMLELKKRNVDTRPVFPAISQYPIWPKQQNPQPTALRVGNQAMNLPSGVCLTHEEVAYVCKQIRELIQK
jgi:perosamine synthetase